MEEEVTAVQAAQMTGRSDRTIRRMIHNNRLPARLIAPNRYAIKVSDLDKVTGQASSIEERLSAIEEKIAHIEELLLELLENFSVSTKKPPRTKSPYDANDQIHLPSTRASTSTMNGLPPGTLTLNEMADELGIKRTTLLGHCTKNNGRLAHEARELQSRPGQYTRFFTPEQAEQARIWHNVHSKK